VFLSLIFFGSALIILIFSFCVGANHGGLTPFMPRIAKDLGPFLLVTSEDTLSLVLDTLSVVVDVGGGSWLPPDLANSIVIAVLDVWAKNNKGESSRVQRL
jgi:hypothetical protein